MLDKDVTVGATHTILADRRVWLDGEVARIARRAAKLGVPAPRVTVLGERTRKVRDEDTGIVRHVAVIDVCLDGGEVKLAGWSLVAALEADEAGVCVRTVPGLACPPELRDVPMTRCDHCQAARLRAAVFVVRHDDGTHKVIGRTCLRDFLGGNDPERLLANAAWTIALGEALDAEGGGGGYRSAPCGLADFLALTCRIAREHGFVTRKQAEIDGRTATSTWVSIRVWGRRTDGTADLFDMAVEDVDTTRAAEIIAWAETIEGDTDYAYNVRQIVEAGIVPSRRAGIAASLYAAHARATEERAKKAARKPSAYVGEIGKRAVYEVTVDGTYVIDGNFGATTIVRMRDREDNVLVWFASNGGLEKGWSGKIKATVKKHEERRGELQTVVTRVAEVVS